MIYLNRMDQELEPETKQITTNVYKINLLAVSILLIFVVIAASIFFTFLPSAEEKVPLKVAYTNNIASLPLLVGLEQRMFSNAGLIIDLVLFDTPEESMAALNRGEVDIALSNDFWVSHYSGRNIKVIASIGEDKSGILISPKANDVELVKELKDNTVVNTCGIEGVYLLSRELELSGLNIEDLKEVKPDRNAEIEDLLSVDSNDIVFAKDIDAFRVLTSLDSSKFNTINIEQKVYWLVATKIDPLHETKAYRNSEAEFLRVLIDSIEFIHQNEQEVINLLERQFVAIEGERLELLSQMKDSFKFDVTLPQELLLVLEEQFSWMERNTEMSMENTSFLSILDFAPLEEVDKDRITVIR